MSTKALSHVLRSTLHTGAKHILMVAVVAALFANPNETVITKADFEPEIPEHAQSTTLQAVLVATPNLKNIKSVPVMPKKIVVSAAGDLSQTKKIVFISRISAYSSTPEETDDTPFITASGKWVRDGIVAANFLPIGTRVMIPKYYGNKVFVVEDRMNPRYTESMDIWMESKRAALNFGVKSAEVHILD